jgi:hypothetical protein
MDKHTSEPTIKILKDSSNKKLKKKNSKLEESEVLNQKPVKGKLKKKKKFSERFKKDKKVKKKKATISESIFDKSKKKDLLKDVDREAFKKMSANQIVKNEENSFSLQQYLLLKEEEMKKKEKENVKDLVQKNQTNVEDNNNQEVTTIDPNSLAANIIKSIKDKPIKQIKTKNKLHFGELEEYNK